jgi:DNA processing protein
LTPMESERPDERISAARLSPFLTAADGNRDAALDLGGDVNLWLLALCSIEGVSGSVIAREALRAGGLPRLLEGEIADRTRAGEATRRTLARELPTLDRHVERAREVVGAAEANVGARLVTVLDGEYPANLRVLRSPPPFLFYRGELRGEDSCSVAVIGTRDATDQGRSRARRLGEQLVAGGVTVVSGLAKGIDTEAHTATLNAGGRTIAVVGTGIRCTYPREDAALADRIAESGAVISQFWPDAPPTRSTFPMRNAVMAGISLGSAVIEAGELSGARMQARIALEQGRHVFLMASLVECEGWAQGCLQRGAIEVCEVWDVLQRLRPPQQPPREQLTLGLA